MDDLSHHFAIPTTTTITIAWFTKNITAWMGAPLLPTLTHAHNLIGRHGFGVCRHLAPQVASAEIVCCRSKFADAARRWEDEGSGGEGKGSSGFQMSLARRGPRAPELQKNTVAHNYYKLVRIWRRGVVYKHSFCHDSAT